jgi:hypothetical protein
MRFHLAGRTMTPGFVRLFLCGAMAAVVLAASCHETRGIGENRSSQPMKQREIASVLKDHAARLMTIPGVVGVYQGETDDGRPCIKVMAATRTPEIEKRVPAEIEGYPVLVEVTGVIRPMR